MKTNIIHWVLWLALPMIVSAAYSQETVKEENKDDGVDQQRPQMPNLFLTVEQRRILEALRQGVLNEQVFNEEEFIPVVLREEALPEEIIRIERSKGVKIDALVKHRKSGKTILWVNNKSYDLDKDKALLERLDNLKIETSDAGGLTGYDNISKSRFNIKVGQSVNKEGAINETLPIVRKKE